MPDSLPKTSVEIRDFPGLVNNADERDLPDGSAAVQVNAMSNKMAELVVRPGYRVVSFENT